MRLIDASPAPVQQGNLLLWQLGAMQAGDERTVTMQLIPEQEGELGSVARVSFEAAASVRTISTRPELKIVQRVPEHGVLIGQQLEIELEISNPGTAMRPAWCCKKMSPKDWSIRRDGNWTTRSARLHRAKCVGRFCGCGLCHRESFKTQSD